MDKRVLLSGQPVPADNSHTEIDPATGMQKDYVVLSAEERAKGFVKPVRANYVHQTCKGVTGMGRELAETYARMPGFYTGTYCVHCRAHFPLSEFTWMNGEPMDPALQPAWEEEQAKKRKQATRARIAELNRELDRLKAELGQLGEE
jgi:hypothetical protein